MSAERGRDLLSHFEDLLWQALENHEGLASDDELPPPPTTSPVAIGIFPFPPVRDSPRSPPPSPSTSSSSTVSETSSEPIARKKMEVTNAYLLSHHHDQMVALMKAKVRALLDQEDMENRKTFHLDWVAGNPSNPVNGGVGSDASVPSDGVSAEDRRLRQSVAATVMRYVYGVQHLNEKEAWNKSVFFGDWLYDLKGQRQFFIEIQVKRVSGADSELQEKCGINHKYAWLSLYDDQAKGIEPVVFPPVPQRSIPALLRNRGLGIPREPGFDTIAEEPEAEVEQEEFAAAPASLQSPKSSADKGKGTAVDGQESTAAGTPTASSPRLPNIGELALRSPHLSPAGSSGTPGTGIPRSLPLPPSGSFNSLESPSQPGEGEPDDPASSYAEEEESTVFFDNTNNPYIQPAPGRNPVVSWSDDPAFQAQVDGVNQAIKNKASELRRIFGFHSDPAFQQRKAKSFIYAVRVVAIPDPGSVVNEFTGPAAPDRNGTLLAQGGWVVPPMEERVAWRDAHKRAYRNKGAKFGKYRGIPKPEVNGAMPIEFDWSNEAAPRYFGEALPVWREAADPCLEDVYWMVWQLVASKQFVGMRTGFGFGIPRADPKGDETLLAECRFRSPSPEAVYHAASYPRGDETKKN